MGKDILKEALAAKDPETGIKINKRFAIAFDEKKKREEYRQASRLLKDEEEEEESESETEDSEGAMITPAVEKTFMELLPMIHARKKEIYDKDKKFFPDYEKLVEEAKEKHAEKKTDKPFKLKDYVRQSILEKMEAEKDASEEEDNSDNEGGPAPHSELMAIKEKLAQQAASSSDIDDDFLVVRSKTEEEIKQEDEDFEKWENTKKQNEKLNPKQLKNLRTEDLLAHFWSASDTADENENFLRKFIVDEDERDLDDIERQEEFEKRHNFRFEEPGGTELVSHPRDIGDSVRREDNKRKRKREQRKKKKELEKLRKEEELKRLKNIKKQEIMDRMKTIQKVTENQKIEMHAETLEKLLEGDYDPEQYDAQMSSLFSDDYYEDDFEEPVKPFVEEKKSKKSKTSETKAEDPETYDEDMGEYEEGEYNEEDDWCEDYDENFCEEAEDSKGFQEIRKRVKSAAPEKIAEKFVEEYYNLDYEDLIGDTPVRFSYQKVKPDSYGLDIMDILEADEKELNAYMPLKKLAPYRRDDPRPRAKWDRKKKQAITAAKRAQEEADNKKKSKPPKKKRKLHK